MDPAHFALIVTQPRQCPRWTHAVLALHTQALLGSTSAGLLTVLKAQPTLLSSSLDVSRV